MQQSVYVQKVLDYLRYSLPEIAEQMVIEDDVIKLSLPLGLTFNEGYKQYQPRIAKLCHLILKREYILKFRIVTPNQTRGFEIFTFDPPV